MNAEEHAEVIVTAGLLRAAGRIDWLGTGLTLLAAASIIMSKGSFFLMAVALLLGLAAKICFVRIALDARLFDDVAARRLGTEELDAALAKLGKGGTVAGERPWPDRCRGARALVIRGSVLTVVEAVTLVFGAVIVWNG